MKEISEILKDYKPKENKQAPPHEKAASVVEILKVVPETKTYNFGYWLRKVGKVKHGRILAVLKDASKLDGKKYSVGGFITNRLKDENTRITTEKQ